VYKVLKRLIAANHLKKKVLSGKWKVIVVNSLNKFYKSTRANYTNKKSLKSE
jgi:hypothetical protein